MVRPVLFNVVLLGGIAAALFLIYLVLNPSFALAVCFGFLAAAHPFLYRLDVHNKYSRQVIAGKLVNFTKTLKLCSTLGIGEGLTVDRLTWARLLSCVFGCGCLVMNFIALIQSARRLVFQSNLSVVQSGISCLETFGLVKCTLQFASFASTDRWSHCIMAAKELKGFSAMRFMTRGPILFQWVATRWNAGSDACCSFTMGRIAGFMVSAASIAMGFMAFCDKCVAVGVQQPAFVCNQSILCNHTLPQLLGTSNLLRELSSVWALLTFANQLLCLHHLDDLVQKSIVAMLFARSDGCLSTEEEHLMERYLDELGCEVVSKWNDWRGTVLWFTFDHSDLQKLVLRSSGENNRDWIIDIQSRGTTGPDQLRDEASLLTD